MTQANDVFAAMNPDVKICAQCEKVCDNPDPIFFCSSECYHIFAESDGKAVPCPFEPTASRAWRNIYKQYRRQQDTLARTRS